MATFGKAIRTGAAAALMLAGITTGAQGFISSTEVFGSGQGTRGIQIRGKVVCVGCSLAEAQKAQPGKNHLYQLTNREGRVVMEVSRVNNSWWYHLTVPYLRVRGEESLFEKLTAEENLFKEVEVTGNLSTSQVLDLRGVSVR